MTEINVKKLDLEGDSNEEVFLILDGQGNELDTESYFLDACNKAVYWARLAKLGCIKIDLNCFE